MDFFPMLFNILKIAALITDQSTLVLWSAHCTRSQDEHSHISYYCILKWFNLNKPLSDLRITLQLIIKLLSYALK
jgi:hypothetical protein